MCPSPCPAFFGSILQARAAVNVLIPVRCSHIPRTCWVMRCFPESCCCSQTCLVLNQFLGNLNALHWTSKQPFNTDQKISTCALSAPCVCLNTPSIRCNKFWLWSHLDQHILGMFTVAFSRCQAKCWAGNSWATKKTLLLSIILVGQ